MDVYEAIADPVRRRILELLTVEPLAARTIAASFGEISRPAVSRHLRVLRGAGLVRADAAGRERIYRVEFGALDAVSVWIAGLGLDLGSRLDALDTEVHRTRRERTRLEPQSTRHSEEWPA